MYLSPFRITDFTGGATAGEITVTTSVGIGEAEAAGGMFASLEAAGEGGPLGAVILVFAFDAWGLYEFGSEYADLQGTVAAANADFGTPIGPIPRRPRKVATTSKTTILRRRTRAKTTGRTSSRPSLTGEGLEKVEKNPLDDPMNICPVCKDDGREHAGPHDPEYHQYVLEALNNAIQQAKANAPRATGAALEGVIREAIQTALNTICDALNKPGKLRDMVTKPCKS